MSMMLDQTQAQDAVRHPLLRRMLLHWTGETGGALPTAAWLQTLASSPRALSRFVLQVQSTLEEQDREMADQQRLLDQSSSEALRLNHTLQERARTLEEALQAREKDQRDLLEARQRLLNQEKLASIGTLAAGIAHEINTPTQFVGDNLSFLTDAFRDLLAIVEQLLPAKPDLKTPEGAMDLDFLRTEIPDALRQSAEGLERVAKIVRSVKEFSHPGATGRLAVDLNKAIESTLTVCRNEWKYVAEVESDLDPELPLLPCVPGEINQVLLNLVVNAAQAIEDRHRQFPGVPLDGKIRLSTRREGAMIRVSVADNGCGIPADVAGRVFDPFFTTKEVGRGTGQGLAIARSVIVNKHQGELTFESVPGQGTTFHLLLPLAGSPT